MNRTVPPKVTSITDSSSKTPLILLCGYLGSGKTTLLLNILNQKSKPKVAILINEFGDIGIDTKIVKKKNINIKEILEGCVCCSLIGEFKAAIAEIITNYHPKLIIVETTGIAEADNLVLDTKNIPNVTLNSIITVVDAHLAYSAITLGHNITLQIKAANIIILNKMDLIPTSSKSQLINMIHSLNPQATCLPTTNCQVDLTRILTITPPSPPAPKIPFLNSSKIYSSTRPVIHHQTFSLKIPQLKLTALRTNLKNIPTPVERMKGYIATDKGIYLLNYVRSRFTLTKSSKNQTPLVVIGKDILNLKSQIIPLLKNSKKE